MSLSERTNDRNDCVESERDRYASRLAHNPFKLLYTLEREGLLTADVGPCWYARHFVHPFLHLALEKAGLLDTLDRDWFARNTPPDLLVDTLEHAGLLTADAGHEWYVRNVHPVYLHTALTKAGFQTELYRGDVLLDLDTIIEDPEEHT